MKKIVCFVLVLMAVLTSVSAFATDYVDEVLTYYDCSGAKLPYSKVITPTIIDNVGIGVYGYAGFDDDGGFLMEYYDGSSWTTYVARDKSIYGIRNMYRDLACFTPTGYIVSYFDVSSGHYAIYCSIYNGNEAGAYTDVDSFVNAIY